jgi:hypothetical protein
VEARPETFSDGPGSPVRRLLVTDTSLVAISQLHQHLRHGDGLPLGALRLSATDAGAAWVERVVVTRVW